MLYMFLAPNPQNNCVQKRAIYHKSQTWCAVPKTDYRLAQGIDRYIALKTDCNDAKDKRFNVGKLLTFCLYAVNLSVDVSCTSKVL